MQSAVVLLPVEMLSQLRVKISWTTPPKPKTTPTMIAAMAATINPYSTADAPRSFVSRITLRRLLSMRIPFWVLGWVVPLRRLLKSATWSTLCIYGLAVYQ